ncbi:hypothetical protein [Rhodococcoides fascians]|uniref:hypothetical protein n=1 Tax=Rhodococcoides fascians TaxID=1828 RepID=UPI0005608B07|nr:hypothetical protein [Rhodococcus fascians]
MTEPRPDTDTDAQPRNWRSWRIPNRIRGVRTSTLFFGVCFVLTGLLYVQVDEVVTAQREDVQGPTAVDPGSYPTQAPQQTYQPTYTSTPSPTTTVDPSATDEQSGAPEVSGDPGSPTGQTGTSATQDPTYLPGLTVPPQLRSLLPPAPQAPTATGSP